MSRCLPVRGMNGHTDAVRGHPKILVPKGIGAPSLGRGEHSSRLLAARYSQLPACVAETLVHGVDRQIEVDGDRLRVVADQQESKRFLLSLRKRSDAVDCQ